MPRSIVALASLALAATQAVAAPCTFDGPRATFAELIASEGLPGGGFLVGTSQGLLAEHYYGSYTPDTVVPIASASKLLGAARIVQVAERGQADLDAPVSTVLPQFTGVKGTMTLRQMFSHTAGYGNDSASPVLLDDGITLAQAVDLIACCRPLNSGYSVGGQFSYGGISMHVAGRVAEVVGGGDWEQRWQSEIGAPLGISTIDWQGLGPTANYGIGGSARSSLRDYGRFLQMLANDGYGNHHRVLRGSSVAELGVDRVEDRPIAYAPPNAAPPVRYGLGAWLSTQAVAPSLLHSLGAFGFLPWVDRERRLYGAFMIRGSGGVNDAAYPAYATMLAGIITEFDAAACTPIALEDGIFAAGFEAF
jgi:CubicO group peptidase (beta-lactamase class C family)